NAPAYCSFEREQNYKAPVSKYAAFAYTSALNHLLADKAHKKRIGDATVVFWAEDAEPGYQDAFSFFVDGSSKDDNEVTNQDLEALMKVIADGNVVNWDNATIEPDNRFYVLALSPNAARISVRFFLRDSFGNMLKNLYAHYQRLEIVSDNRTKFKNIPLWALLRETINQKSTDKTPSPQMAGDTLKAILTGGLYPTTLYMQTQMRIRAEREIPQGRAAIIKAYLLRNAEDKNIKEVLTVELNENTKYQPYVLGRLFSVLEEVQNQASGATSIKDKYFTSACATPSVVFPMILSLADKHLRKLEGGRKVHYAKRIGELMGMITESYPAHHNLHDQGIFQLGYYHQTQKRYEKKNNNKETMEEN
ncbi:MAG: type I-C CRISPR-associated protein Cas8c/Csd1, partial [Clostridiales bacterium]|nr:type I-C CRISPR-associated protein Cas8c/Csd1 [Clostridiales bacterium]